MHEGGAPVAMGRLDGKVALVTGAASGIGLVTARRLAQEGARVVLADVDEKGGEAAARGIGGDARFVRCDVTKTEDVRGAVDLAVRSFGRLDVAHNNAGWEGRLAKLADVDEADFDRVVAVNLKGVFLCMKHEIPAMVAAGGGSIVNTASVAGLVANQGAAGYAASKHGVVGLTRTAAAEYARKGVRVNAVCPGWTETPMSRRVGEENARVMEGYVSRVPAGRLARPEEVAALVAFLASDEARYLTGAALPLDGAWTAQ
jgi:NAD(P)-dependent dehydrogenase (short-subunit alcohol dehydrogenase family)